jgi:hypothetical protein
MFLRPHDLFSRFLFVVCCCCILGGAVGLSIIFLYLLFVASLALYACLDVIRL